MIMGIIELEVDKIVEWWDYFDVTSVQKFVTVKTPTHLCGNNLQLPWLYCFWIYLRRIPGDTTTGAKESG